MASRAASGAGAAAPRTTRRAWWVLVGILFVAAFALRAMRFGDPYIHVDEIFYLQVGDLMLQGQLPYVDLWDRKPIGLFLLYAAIRLLGGDGILQYQVVATLFAFATAVVVAGIALRQAGPSGACAAGLLYLAFLEPLGGGGGQSPVFYNLFVALAALLALKAAETAETRAVARLGIAAMSLLGLAIQVKYTAAIEGCFFGLAFLWLIWSRTRRFPAVMGWGVLFVLCGLAPTLAVAGFYAALGAWDAFWFANFTSIMLRGPTAPDEVSERLAYFALVLTPLLLAAGLAQAVRLRGPRRNPGELLPLGWVLAAAGGVAVIGTFYFHYALPLVAPLAVAAAPLLDRGRLGAAVTGICAVWALLVGGFPQRPVGESQAEIRQITKAVQDHLGNGCLFIFDGPAIVHHLTRACAVTRYIFPYHLNSEVERTGLGVDPLEETRRSLAARPSVVVSADVPEIPPNRATWRLIGAVLERDYRRVGNYRVGRRIFTVWARDP